MTVDDIGMGVSPTTALLYIRKVRVAFVKLVMDVLDHVGIVSGPQPRRDTHRNDR